MAGAGPPLLARGEKGSGARQACQTGSGWVVEDLGRSVPAIPAQASWAPRGRSTTTEADAVLELNKVPIEGFKKPVLRLVAKAAGIDDKTIAALGTLKLLRLCLDKRGVEPEIIGDCVMPLQELYGFRSSQGVAHIGTKKLDQDQREHYRNLIARCDQAMQVLAEFIRAGMFNVP